MPYKDPIKAREYAKLRARKSYLKNKRVVLDRSLKSRYGLTGEAYQALFEAQNRKCKICFKESSRRLCVDHDHRTGRIRGLLCSTCNAGLGSFYDDSSLLQNAIKYLET